MLPIDFYKIRVSNAVLRKARASSPTEARGVNIGDNKVYYYRSIVKSLMPSSLAYIERFSEKRHTCEVDSYRNRVIDFILGLSTL